MDVKLPGSSGWLIRILEINLQRFEQIGMVILVVLP